jgi:hypothetical protein
MGRIVAALATGKTIPSDIRDFGVTAEALDPARFAR